MDKIKRFIDCAIPTKTCNLQCHYCYIGMTGRFRDEIVEFDQTPETIRKALSKKRLGGTCMLNLCAGGETLLGESVLPTVKALLEEGHYVTIVTNGTLRKRFEELAVWPKELTERLMLKMSFHYLELKRLNGFENFFGNLELVKKAGASYSVEVTPSDELIPHIDDLKAMCMERLGTLCHITFARNDTTEGRDLLSKHDLESYKSIWGTFESDLFAYKARIYEEKRREFCHAGDWTLYINLKSGTVRQCYKGERIDNIYRNIDEPLNLKPIGCNCPEPYCYNGHAFLTFGAIGDLEAPTYGQMRNRVNKDGEEWLMPKMKAFTSQKLKDMN